MKESSGGEKARQNREGKGRQKDGEPLPEGESDDEKSAAYGKRRSPCSRTERVVRGEPSRAVADGHTRDRAREEIRCTERQGETSGSNAVSALSEIHACCIDGRETGVGERERQLRDHERGERGGKRRRRERREFERRRAERRESTAFHEHDHDAHGHESECNRPPTEDDGDNDDRDAEGNCPLRGERIVAERRRRIGDEAPSDLEKQEAHSELDPANERAGERAAEMIDQAGAPENDEGAADHERRGGDLVGAETLRNRDRTNRLQGLDCDRQPVDERDCDVEQPRRKKHEGCREPVLDDECDGDGHEHADIRYRPGKLPLQARAAFSRLLHFSTMTDVAFTTPEALMPGFRASRSADSRVMIATTRVGSVTSIST